MKKRIAIFIFLLALPLAVLAENKSLNEAVSEVKKKEKGQIISARTLSTESAGQYHEIRVLTAKGSIKTIKVPAGGKRQSKNRNDGGNYQSRSNQQRSTDNSRSRVKQSQLKSTSRERTTVNRKRDNR